MSKKTFISTAVLFFSAFILLSGCGKSSETTMTSNIVVATPSSVTPILPGTVSESPAATEAAVETPKKEGVKSLLTGEIINKKYKNKRPFAFMFNNIEFAYPQSGTGRAGILYEILAEGGITRLMGLFDYMSGDRIGSVRSARHYYVDFAKEFDAFFIHFGQTHYAISEIKKLSVDTLSGLAAEGATVFYRDNSIQAPHNAFASAKGINKAITDKKYRTKLEDGIGSHFNFIEDGETDNDLEGSKKAEYVSVPFSHYMSPYFTYSDKTGRYTRYAFGTKHIDKATGKALTFKNIFIQFVNEYNKDKNGYQTMDLIGASGDGYYITNGRAVKVFWKKPDGTTKTAFYYDKGYKDEVVVNVGKTYYAVFPLNRKDMVKFKK